MYRYLQKCLYRGLCPKLSTNKTAVECMKDYIEHSAFSNEEKEEMKNNYEHWADITFHGIKQRLRDSHKFYE